MTRMRNAFFLIAGQLLLCALWSPVEAFTVQRHNDSPSRIAPTRLQSTVAETAGEETLSSTAVSQLARDRTNVILYDGICVFCNTWVDLLLRIDVNAKFRFAPLQSQLGQELLVSVGKEADDISSVVLIKTHTGESYDKSACVLAVVEELGPVAALASRAALQIVPRSIRDGIYETVAENRYRFMGQRDECRCSDPKYADRFLLD